MWTTAALNVINYITKYVNKCSDMATFAIADEGRQEEVKILSDWTLYFE